MSHADAGARRPASRWLSAVITIGRPPPRPITGVGDVGRFHKRATFASVRINSLCANHGCRMNVSGVTRLPRERLAL